MEANRCIREQVRCESAGYRDVLVVVPATGGTRLSDLLTLIEGDLRMRVAFTATDAEPACYRPVLPWQQAIRYDWDLVLAAGHRHLAELRGPTLLVPDNGDALASYEFVGATTSSTITLSTEAERTALNALFPEAAPRAVLAGDICLDRLVASLQFRGRYRRAFGVPEDGLLVALGSTSGSGPELCGALLGEVSPHEGRVTLVLHSRRCKARLDDGLVLVPPESWRAAVVAADWVIADHTATIAYAAAIGRPVAVTSRNDPHDVVPHRVPVLDRDAPLLPQRQAALSRVAPVRRAVSPVLTSRPGAAASILRATTYRLLGIPLPAHGLPAAAVPLPDRVRW